MENEDPVSEEEKDSRGERNSPSPWKQQSPAAGKEKDDSPWKQQSPAAGKEKDGSPWKQQSPAAGKEKDGSPWKQLSPGVPKQDDPDFQEEANLAPTEEPPTPPEEEILVPAEDEAPTDVTAGWSRRRRNRAVAIQFIYAWSMNRPDDLADSLDEFFIERELNRDDYVFAEELIHGATSKMDEIDALVRETAENWEFERIAKIDLTLLRLGIHELLHRPDVPPVVVINEIIDLGKAFSEEKSKRFLNGILDRVLAQLDRPARESSI